MWHSKGILGKIEHIYTLIALCSQGYQCVYDISVNVSPIYRPLGYERVYLPLLSGRYTLLYPKLRYIIHFFIEMIVFKICRVVLKYDTMVLKGLNVLLGTGDFTVSRHSRQALNMVITHTSAGDKKRGTIKVDIRTGLVQAE